MIPLPLRRAAIFSAVLFPGVALVAWLGGGVFVAEPGEAIVSRTSPGGTGAVVSIDRGPGIGAGRRGRMERDAVAVIGNRPVHYRAWTADWSSSEPLQDARPGVVRLRLADGRVVLHAEPEKDREPTLDEDAPGTTLVTGRNCILTQTEDGPPSARLEGEATARHALERGDSMTLRSDVLELRSEERPGTGTKVRIVESDRPVRIEGGGAAIDGTGLTAEFAGSRRTARVERDVSGVLDARKGQAPARWSCKGPAILEAIDDGAQDARRGERATPWRATFRDDAVFEDADARLRGEEVIVEFVRTTEADRRAGAPATDVRKLLANGSVVVEGARQGAAWRATSDRLRGWAEDVLTQVSVFEGSPRFTFTSAPDAAGTVTLHEITCTGPATLRERRPRLAKGGVDEMTITFDGDVQAREWDAATRTLRSELRAPRVTIEGRRPADGRFEPLVARAEGGADLRRLDLAARGKTVVWTARRAGADERITLVGDPVVTYADTKGTSPFGGEAQPGVFAIASKERIDVDLAPPPAGSSRRSGAARVSVRGGLVARKLVGDEEVYRLTADHGDADFSADGDLREFRAYGTARLSGRGAGPDGRSGRIAGDRIHVTRTAAPGAARAQDFDAIVHGGADGPALALVADAAGKLHHELRAREIRHEQGGSVVVASQEASADLQVPGDGAGADPRTRPSDAPLRLVADEIRADVDRPDGGRAALRLLTAQGRVALDESLHRLTGDRIVYEDATGRAESWGAPARVVRRFPPTAAPEDRYESYVSAPQIRAFFDRNASGNERFLRATCPQGGTLVAYHFASPDGNLATRTRERVTITSRGPIDLEPSGASAVGGAVAVWEQRMPDGLWQLDSRVDAQRMDATFERGTGTAPRDALRSLVATGTPDVQARLQSRNPSGTRDATALAERMEIEPHRTRVRMSCPSGRSRVFVHETVSRRKTMCDSVSYNYRTWEWDDAIRVTEVE